MAYESRVNSLPEVCEDAFNGEGISEKEQEEVEVKELKKVIEKQEEKAVNDKVITPLGEGEVLLLPPGATPYNQRKKREKIDGSAVLQRLEWRIGNINILPKKIAVSDSITSPSFSTTCGIGHCRLQICISRSREPVAASPSSGDISLPHLSHLPVSDNNNDIPEHKIGVFLTCPIPVIVDFTVFVGNTRSQRLTHDFGKAPWGGQLDVASFEKELCHNARSIVVGASILSVSPSTLCGPGELWGVTSLLKNASHLCSFSEMIDDELLLSSLSSFNFKDTFAECSPSQHHIYSSQPSPANSSQISSSRHGHLYLPSSNANSNANANVNGQSGALFPSRPRGVSDISHNAEIVLSRFAGGVSASNRTGSQFYPGGVSPVGNGNAASAQRLEEFVNGNMNHLAKGGNRGGNTPPGDQSIYVSVSGNSFAAANLSKVNANNYANSTNNFANSSNNANNFANNANTFANSYGSNANSNNSPVSPPGYGGMEGGNATANGFYHLVTKNSRSQSMQGPLLQGGSAGNNYRGNGTGTFENHVWVSEGNANGSFLSPPPYHDENDMNNPALVSGGAADSPHRHNISTISPLASPSNNLHSNRSRALSGNTLISEGKMRSNTQHSNQQQSALHPGVISANEILSTDNYLSNISPISPLSPYLSTTRTTIDFPIHSSSNNPHQHKSSFDNFSFHSQSVRANTIPPNESEEHSTLPSELIAVAAAKKFPLQSRKELSIHDIEPGRFERLEQFVIFCVNSSACGDPFTIVDNSQILHSILPFDQQEFALSCLVFASSLSSLHAAFKPLLVLSWLLMEKSIGAVRSLGVRNLIRNFNVIVIELQRLVVAEW